MTQQLEKLTANVYVLWSAILFAAAGGWSTCAYLGAISAQIEKQGIKQEAYQNHTDYRLDQLQHGQDDAHSWQLHMATQLDYHDTQFSKINQYIEDQKK